MSPRPNEQLPDRERRDGPPSSARKAANAIKRAYSRFEKLIKAGSLVTMAGVSMDMKPVDLNEVLPTHNPTHEPGMNVGMQAEILGHKIMAGLKTDAGIGIEVMEVDAVSSEVERSWSIGLNVPGFSSDESSEGIVARWYHSFDKPFTPIPAEAMHAPDAEDAASYQETFKTNLASSVIGFGWDAATTLDQASAGPSALEVGRIDVSAAADQAGEDTKTGQAVRETLEAMGIGTTDAALTFQEGDLSFTPETYATLLGLAASLDLPGGPDEQIYELLSRYNTNAPIDERVVRAIDTMLGALSFIHVDLTFAEGKTDSIPVPLPLLFMFVLRGAMGWKKSEGNREEQPPADTRERLLDRVPQSVETWQSYLDRVFSGIKNSSGDLLLVLDQHVAERELDVNGLTHDLLDLWNKQEEQRRAARGRRSSRRAPVDLKTDNRQVLLANLYARSLAVIHDRIRSGEARNFSAALLQPEARVAIGLAIKNEMVRLAELGDGSET